MFFSPGKNLSPSKNKSSPITFWNSVSKALILPQLSPLPFAFGWAGGGGGGMGAFYALYQRLF